MNRIIGIIGGITTFMTCFYVYLNLINEKSYSFEDTLKIIRQNFKNEPFKFILYVLIFLLLSLIISFIINKIINVINIKEEERKYRIKNSIESQKQIKEKRDEVYKKMIDTKIDFRKTINKPWLKVKSEHHTLILRDICDKSFPKLGKWFKAEVFDIHTEGIEFFDISTAIGFDIYFDEDDNWDVFFRREKLKRGNFYKIPTETLCTFLIPFEEILEFDWEHDDYIGCATAFCQFKYKHKRRLLPYKKEKYYIKKEYDILEILDDRKHKIFKPIWWRIINIIFLRPLRRYRYWKRDLDTKRKAKKIQSLIK